jgi:hypothetical protein
MLRLLRRYPVWLIPALASASGAQAASDTSVLCSWEFLVVMSSYDEACSLEQNLDMKRALAESISQLDAFIVRHANLPNAAELLARKKDELRRDVFTDVAASREGGLNPCSDDEELGVAKDYRAFAESNPPAKLRAWVTDDLARAESREYPLAGICF